MTISDKIKHVVVLMLENRSFDNILGHLHHINPEIDGITDLVWRLYSKEPAIG